MPQILIILLYSAVFCLLIAKVQLFKIKDLAVPFVCAVFFVKIAVGILYGYIHQVYFNGGDTFDFYYGANQIATTIFTHPDYYFKTLLWMSPEVPAGADVFMYPDWQYIKKDFGTYLISHLHALPQLLSFGYYNVHVVFVALLSLLGSLNMYRALRDTISIPKPLLIFSCFFMPSVLFWTSGLHKDVWVYFGISLVLLGLRKLYLNKNAANIELLAGLVTVGLFRYYLLPIMIPGIMALAWSVLKPGVAPLYRFLSVYGLFGILMLLMEGLGFFPLMSILAERQQEFLSETGDSAIPGVAPMLPSVSGLFFQLPEALLNVCFRPFIWDCKDILQYIASFEIMIFWVFALFSIPYRRTERLPNPMSYFLFFYAAGNLLLIGLLVSNVGTIVRYRAIALSMLFVVVLQAFDYIRFGIRQRQLSKVTEFKGGSNKKTAAFENSRL